MIDCTKCGQFSCTTNEEMKVHYRESHGTVNFTKYQEEYSKTPTKNHSSPGTSTPRITIQTSTQKYTGNVRNKKNQV